MIPHLSIQSVCPQFPKLVVVPSIKKSRDRPGGEPARIPRRERPQWSLLPIRWNCLPEIVLIEWAPGPRRAGVGCVPRNSRTHNQVFTGRRLEDSPDSGYEKTHL